MDERLERYAELCVRVGSNVQAGQEVFVIADVEHRDLARALTREAYRAGAAYVHLRYDDMHARRAMIELGPGKALTYAPEWLKTFTEAMSGNAMIATTGDPTPDLLSDLDGERVGRAVVQEVAQIRRQQMSENTINWCVVGAPNEGWARQVFGEPDVERLWHNVAFCMRLDESDPIAAWREHLAKLQRRASSLNELRPDRLHYRGPGTNLTVGLLREARWVSDPVRTASGIEYVGNMPTEEIFTTPDGNRADGTLRSRKPLALGGQIVDGLQLTLDGGRIVAVEAERGADLIREQLATDEGAARLGELALVTEDSRVGRTGITFFNTLFDENATCHIAYGMGIPDAFEEGLSEGMNVSAVHTDFMVGGPELEIDAVLADGSTVPLIRDETWQLPD